jgi:hypothetical protein
LKAGVDCICLYIERLFAVLLIGEILLRVALVLIRHLALSSVLQPGGPVGRIVDAAPKRQFPLVRSEVIVCSCQDRVSAPWTRACEYP